MIFVVDLLIRAHEPAVEPVAVSRGIAVIPLAFELNEIPVVDGAFVCFTVYRHIGDSGNG